MHMAGVLISFAKRSGDRLWKDVLRKSKPPRGQPEAAGLPIDLGYDFAIPVTLAAGPIFFTAFK
jgi:hypothetical protein